MASEPESLEHLSFETAERIVGEWIKIHLDLMRSGHGRRGDVDEAVQKAIDEVQHLHLASHYVLVGKLFDAMKLAGWKPPEGYVMVTYDKRETTDGE